MSFEAFPKIPRLFRDCVITEKIDGTNAQILIEPRTQLGDGNPFEDQGWCILLEDKAIRPGSRNRWISPENDNYGFAKWVLSNAEILSRLGYGRHFGEWWGNGIQRGYGLKEKRFSLFNVGVWTPEEIEKRGLTGLVSTVPILGKGLFGTAWIQQVKEQLELYGSQAAPGFMDPEGVVVFHSASGELYKSTIKGDEKPKGSKE